MRRARDETAGDGKSSESGEDTPTALLKRMAAGDDAAAHVLLPLLYQELRAVAGAAFRRERASHTLEPTAIVHEAWIRLVGSEQPDYESRSHFLAIAARTMRRILVEHARARTAEKRGGGATHVTLGAADSGPHGTEPTSTDVLAVHEALEALAVVDERQAAVVELRWFGGLSVQEVSRHLSLSPRTVELEWTMAKAWLRRRLRDASD